MTRTLFYVPVIHMAADLGSLAPDLAQRGMKGLGEDLWKKHLATIEGFWNSLASYFDAMEGAGVKIYQDGLVADGEMGRKIVEEGLKSGSKNYEVVSRLIGKGALLVRTEDLELVKKERDCLVEMTSAATKAKKMMAYLKYRGIKNQLLAKRDRFIAHRINDTLKPGETGVLFIGAYHNVLPFLEKDIGVREIKEIEKIRDYQKALHQDRKNQERFEALSRYLAAPVNIEE